MGGMDSGHPPDPPPPAPRAPSGARRLALAALLALPCLALGAAGLLVAWLLASTPSDAMSRSLQIMLTAGGVGWGALWLWLGALALRVGWPR